MARINNTTQYILKNMILDKFKAKRDVLSSELDAIKKQNYEIANENKDKSRESIVRIMDKAQDDIVKILKSAGLEIDGGYRGAHPLCLFDSKGKLQCNWKDYLHPIGNKNKKLQSLEEDMKELDDKCRKAMDELVLRATLGCKYDDVMEFINNLEV